MTQMMMANSRTVCVFLDGENGENFSDEWSWKLV